MKAHRSTSLTRTASPAQSATAVAPGRHVFVASELRGRSLQVICHDRDTDESYALRCELFALATKAARDS